MARSHGYRWTILGIGAFASAAFSMFRQGLPALGPALRDDFGLSLAEVGLMFTAVAVGLAIGLVPWGILTDRIGERPVLSIGLALLSIALAVTSFASDYAMLLASLALCGLFGGSAAGASGRAIMGWFAASERGTALGVRQMAIPVGGAIGSLTLPLLADAGGLSAAMLVLAGVAMTAAVASAIWIRDSPATALRATDIDRPMGDSRQWRLGIASALLVVCQAAALGFFVLFLHDRRGLSLGAAAAFLAAIQIGSAIGRIAVGRRSDTLGLRIPLMRKVAACIAAGFAATAALASAPGLVLYPVLLASGTIALSWNGLAFTASAEIAGLARAGTAMSLQNTIVTAGAVAAPFAFGAVVGVTSYAVGFALAALCPLTAFVLLRALQEDETLRARDRSAAIEAAGGVAA